MQLQNIFPNPTPFLTKIFKILENKQIDVSTYELDHICYRLETIERYDFFKKELSTIATLLSESVVGGRVIATYKLHIPIIFNDRQIWCIELPSQKLDHFTKKVLNMLSL